MPTTTNDEHDDNCDCFSVAALLLRHRLLGRTDSSLRLVLTVVTFQSHDFWLLHMIVDVSDNSIGTTTVD